MFNGWQGGHQEPGSAGADSEHKRPDLKHQAGSLKSGGKFVRCGGGRYAHRDVEPKFLVIQAPWLFHGQVAGPRKVTPDAGCILPQEMGKLNLEVRARVS